MTAKRVIALILVVLLLGAGVYYLRKVENADKRNMRDLYTEVEPLQRQREALVAERDQLEFDYALQMRDVSTIQLLIREMDEEVYTEVYPLMRDRGIVGVLGINTKQLPGLRGKMTIDQFNRLLMDGWGTCLIFEKNQNFSLWFNSVSNWLTREGLPVPMAIYFPDGNYDSSLDEKLAERGISTVILPAENGRSATVTSLDGELWFTGAMPWNYTGVATDTELLARTNGANLTFTMSLNDHWDAYEKEPFTHVLDSWAEMLDVDDPLADLVLPTPTPNPNDPNASLTPEDELLKPLLKSTNYESAREAHLTAQDSNTDLKTEFENRKAQMDRDIAALDEQIREIYSRWEQSGKIAKGQG